MGLLIDRIRGPGGVYRIAVTALGVLRLALPGGFPSRLAFRREVDRLLARPLHAGVPRRDPEAQLEQARELVAEWSCEAAWQCFYFPPLLDLRGTPFRRKVWETLRGLAPGQTESYGDLAERTGSPRAARAVGTAMRCNPVALLVPCHRVVAANGPGKFGSAGVGLKLRLLAMERA